MVDSDIVRQAELCGLGFKDVLYVKEIISSTINNTLFKKKVYFVGSAQSGRSTLINRLLNRYISPQRQHRMTGRIIHITYSNVLFVSEHPIMLENCVDTSPTKIYFHRHIYGGDVDIDNIQENILQKILIVGIPNKLLHNMDLIDTPAIFHKKEVDDEILRRIHKDKAVVVCTLNGCLGLVKELALFINQLHKLDGVTVKYFVTHLMPKVDLTPNPADVEDECLVLSVVRRRFIKLYNKLVACNFIAKDDNNSYVHPDIFGADLWRIQDLQGTCTSAKAYDEYLQCQWDRFVLTLKLCMYN